MSESDNNKEDETVWLFSKTPNHSNRPTPTSIFRSEEDARKTARVWRSDGWKTDVEPMDIRDGITGATEGKLKRD